MVEKNKQQISLEDALNFGKEIEEWNGGKTKRGGSWVKQGYRYYDNETYYYDITGIHLSGKRDGLVLEITTEENPHERYSTAKVELKLGSEHVFNVCYADVNSNYSKVYNFAESIYKSIIEKENRDKKLARRQETKNHQSKVKEAKKIMRK